MVNVKYYIDKSKKDKNGLTPIIASIVVDYQESKKTVAKVKKQYWNPNKQKVNKSKPHEPDNEYQQINNLLDNFQEEAKEYFRRCNLNRITITLGVS